MITPNKKESYSKSLQNVKIFSNKILIFGLLATSLLVGCKSIPIKFQWPHSKYEKQIAQLEKEKQDLAATFEIEKDKIKEEVEKSQETRYSKGTAQVYAADATLEADANANKYTLAASKALDVAREALPTPTIEDLTLANKIQADLLSEQADKIAKAEKELGIVRNEVIAAKNKEQELKEQKDRLQEEFNKKAAEYDATIKEKDDQLNKERLQFAGERDEKARQFEYDNVWYRRLNPLTHLGKMFSSLFFWIVIFVVIGGILKILSVIFPGVGVVQVIIGGMGRILGGGIKLIGGFIPDLLNGMGAVKEDEYKTERELANNVIGSIQELRNTDPATYDKIRPFLIDWFKDSDPQLKEIVEKRIKELNLK